ncbi:MAG: hypothetical protein H6737_17720 [Alphaproteobacteria bacterium]|nr:hypothetical protein [Alphaproteobacteria bacterium]
MALFMVQGAHAQSISACGSGEAPSGFVGASCSVNSVPVCSVSGGVLTCDMSMACSTPPGSTSGFMRVANHGGGGISAWGQCFQGSTSVNFCCRVDDTTSAIGVVNAIGTNWKEEPIAFESGELSGSEPNPTWFLQPTGGGELKAQILAKNGNDIIVGSPSTSKFYSETLNGQGHDDDIRGLAGDDTILGGGGIDFILGDDGDDVIDGGNGVDGISGGPGNDEIHGGNHDDIINGDDGNDKIWGDDGDDTLMGDDGNDDLIGGGGNDTMEGGIGNDRLHGGDGNDELLGQNGNDKLFGGAGADVLDGGANDDYLCEDLFLDYPSCLVQELYGQSATTIDRAYIYRGPFGCGTLISNRPFGNGSVEEARQSNPIDWSLVVPGGSATTASKYAQCAEVEALD